MAWVFCDPRETRVPAVFLRTHEAKDGLELSWRVSWISSTSLSDRAKSLMAAFWIRAPTQTAPRLLIQSYLSRPQGQPGLACRLDVWKRSPPTPSHLSASLASPPLLYGWHMEAISIYPQHQDAASCCAPASGILGFPAGPFQRLHAKQPAVCRERQGPLHQSRQWPSVHMGHPGLSESQGWRRSVFCPSLSGCFLAYCFPTPLSVL